jgi:hypothetical protein
MTSTDGNIVIVKDSKTGLLGAVVCPEGTRGVVFEDGEWVVDTTTKNLVKVGEAVYDPPRIEPFGKIPADIQQRYVEAALAALAAFKGDKP